MHFNVYQIPNKYYSYINCKFLLRQSTDFKSSSHEFYPYCMKHGFGGWRPFIVFITYLLSWSVVKRLTMFFSHDIKQMHITRIGFYLLINMIECYYHHCGG